MPAALFEGFDIQASGVAAPQLMQALGLTPQQIGMFFTALVGLGWSPAAILDSAAPLFALCGLFTILLARRL